MLAEWPSSESPTYTPTDWFGFDWNAIVNCLRMPNSDHWECFNGGTIPVGARIILTNKASHPLA